MEKENKDRELSMDTYIMLISFKNYNNHFCFIHLIRTDSNEFFLMAE